MAPAKGKGRAGSKGKKKNTTSTQPQQTEDPAYDPAKDPVLFQQFLDSLNKMTRKSSSTDNKRAREEEQSRIREKTSQLLQQEQEEDSQDEDLPPPSKKSRSHALLSDDEENLARNLDGPNHNDGNDIPNQSDRDFQVGEPNNDENEDDGGGAAALDEEGNDDSESLPRTIFTSNGINISAPKSKSTSHRGTPRYHSISPAPSTLQSESVNGTSTATNGSKVKCSDFPPNIRLLADAAKCLLRTRICFGDWLMESDPERQKWIWQIIKDTPQTIGASSADDATSALKIVASAAQSALCMNVITYVGYGKGSLFNNIITKARSRVVGHYCLSGTPIQISEKAEWLLEASHFIYGDLNAKEKTFNPDMPFGNAIIKDLIQAIWFNATRAKADIGTTRQMVKESQIPVPTLLLIVTAIEHSIGEYRTGSETQTHFKEQQLRTRYKYHRNTWKGLQARSPAWTEVYGSAFFMIISKSVNMGHLADNDKAENKADIEKVIGENLDKVVSEGRSIFG